jgi:hypothetical protein
LASAADWQVPWVPDSTPLGGKSVRFSLEPQTADPAGRLAGRAAEFEWPSLQLAAPSPPTIPPPALEPPVSDTQNAVTAPYVADSSSSASSQSEGNEKDSPPLEEIASRAAKAEHDDPSSDIWPEPVVLIERLEELAWECETGEWAWAVSRQVREVDSMVRDRSDRQALLAALDRLEALNRAGDDLDDQIETDSLATRFRRARHALTRRLPIWRGIVRAGGLDTSQEHASRAVPARLASCLARVEANTRSSFAGRTWQEYLDFDALKRIAKQPESDDRPRRRELVRRVLDRLNRPGLTANQKAFVANGPMAELHSELRHWAADSVDFGGLLRNLEQYEQTGRPADARLVAEECSLLGHSTDPEQQELGRQLDAHYRNANLRIAVTPELLNRLMPDREPEYHWVDDVVMGNSARGRSVTHTRVGVRMVPDPKGARAALEIRGRVSSLTESETGPITLWNGSRSVYVALKEIEVGCDGLRLHPAQVSVDSNVQLCSTRSKLDMIPLIGSVANEIARAQHSKSRPELNREVERKVAARAKRQIDQEADSRLGTVNQKLRDRVLQPLSSLSLGPTMVQAQTTERRLVMRLLLAAEGQLAANTPRPRAPGDSLVSCQVHESALNNVIEQLQFDGGTFTLAEINRRIADTFQRPEMLEENPGREDVKITFAEKDAIRVHFREGRIEVRLAIAKLRKSPHSGKDFQVCVYYRPEIRGRSVELIRDGGVRLIASKSLRSQFYLRTVFSTTFSKQRHWKPIPDLLAADPRLEGLAVTQFKIDDGWIGIAFGPDRSASEPLVARRTAKESR